MSLALYMDHHVHSAITDGLRQRGVDVLTAWDDGTADWDDEDLLVRATELGRVLFSLDEDLLVVATEWQRTGRGFAGLAYAHQLKITIGQAINDLELVAGACSPVEMRDRIEFIPF